jgi:mRNA interferase MazF
MSAINPSYGEVWAVDFSPTRGREQAGQRPAVVVSNDAFNHGPAEMCVVLPITSKAKGIPLHVEVTPPEGGLTMKSFIKCDDIRAVSKERFGRQLGIVSEPTMQAVAERLRHLLNLDQP